MINDGAADEVIGRFETEIISQNKIIELEKELNEVIIRADNAEAENLRLKNEIKMLKNQLNSINL